MQKRQVWSHGESPSYLAPGPVIPSSAARQNVFRGLFSASSLGGTVSTCSWLFTTLVTPQQSCGP